MADSFRFNQGPAPEVLRYLEGRGLRQSYSWKDWYGSEHAYAFTVAKAMQVEVLSTIHEEMTRAIKEGLPLASFRKAVAPRLRQLGWWGKADMVDPLTEEVKRVQLGSNRRLKTIYWANTRTAYAAGKWERYQRTKAALPYLLYQLGPSAEHRPHHAAKEGVILPIDDPFWVTWFPPNGWGCKCWTRQITAREAESLGGVTDRPDIKLKEWVNDRTGETMQIPEGIDPGWETNPGLERGRTVANFLKGKLDEAPELVRRAAINDMVKSFHFDRIVNGVYGKRNVAFAPVAAAPDDIVKASGAKTRTILISPETAAKQLFKRNQIDRLELKVEDYARAQALLDTGRLIQEGDDHFVAVGPVEGSHWLAVFKVTKSRQAIFLQSFRRSNYVEMERRLKRGKLIRGEKLAP